MRLLLPATACLALTACGIDVLVAPDVDRDAPDAGRVTTPARDAGATRDAATMVDASPTDAEPDGEAAAPCVLALPSLLAWWRAEGDATDSRGDLDGTIAGALTYVPGMVGRAFVLGGNEYVEVARTELDLRDAFSLEAWVWIEGDGRILDRHFGNTSRGYTLDVIGQRLRLVIGTGSDAGLVASVAPDAVAPLSTWTHVVATFGPAGLRLYVNGVKAAEGDPVGAVVPTTGAFRIGAGSFSDGTIAAPFLGRIDEAVVYSSQLSDDDVAALATDSLRRCVP